ncbi:MAG TPA: cupin domain-containing protein [Steroidobacteraceae bacterium]
MKTTLSFTLAALGVMWLAATSATAEHIPPISGAKDVKWGPPPPALPPGAKMAVLAGDPASTGLITIRIKMPAGYKVPPHWHPTDEHVTVLTGSLLLGMGDTLEESQAKTLTSGGYAVAPANMHHFAMTKTGAVIQITLNGPFGITYVNPADDPSKKAAASKP